MLTRPQVEAAEVSRARDALAFAGRSLATDGTNPDLSEPMARALALFGVPVADRSAVTTADLAGLAPSAAEQFLDYLEILVLELCARKARFGPQSVSFPNFKADMGSGVQSIEALLADARRAYSLRYNRTSAPAVGEMDRGVRHALRTDRLYGRRRRPPWPPE